MWHLVHLLVDFFYNSILELMFFVLIDMIVKSPLREARTEEEKRSIWLYESLFLGIICVLIYLFDHNPLLLIGLACFTLIYTQLAERIGFSIWWNNLHRRWDEYQQHTDNISKIKAWQKSVQESPWRKKGVVSMSKISSFLPGFIRSCISKIRGLVYRTPETDAISESPLNNRLLIDDSPFQVGSERFKPIVQLPVDSAFPSATVSSQQKLKSPEALARQYSSGTVYQNKHDQTASSYVSQPNKLAFEEASNPTTLGWFNSKDLKRRPLRTNSSFKISSVSSYQGTTQSFRSKFASVLGFYGSWSKTPVGLKNEGQNLCFMNSVIQCLARSPFLVSGISKEMNADIDCSVAESQLLNSFVELLVMCSNKGSKHKVFEPTAFKEAVTVLNNNLVAARGERQCQQDAAEFIMWLMETLSSILNKKSFEGETDGSDKVSVLKFIYGDLTPARITDLKEACRKEINGANGLDNESYAEPIQRLSDLEWLTYKQNNKSTIDNLFTGQLVEAYHCLLDNHLSVNMQTFNILPVPIIQSQSVSGLVFLEDCFTKFCNIEHLIGKEGLDCTFCNSAKSQKMEDTPKLLGHGPSSRMTRNLLQKHTAVSSVDSAVHSTLGSVSYMSPILGQREIVNDSGFHDNVFRTSTPLGEQTDSLFPTQFLRDAQRRCLLRQLPDCLVIQLLRFTYNQFTQQPRKICASVSIPLKGLDMTSIVYDKVTNRDDLTAAMDSYKFDLYGICAHLGSESTSCGHYIAYCQESDGTWFKFDDELVWDVNMEYEITTREVRENAYLLFYKRAKQDQDPRL